MQLPEATTIEAGTSILFLGAGFSAEAKNFANVAIKDVEGLKKLLLDEIGEPVDGYDLESAAEEYVRYHGEKGAEKVTQALHANFRSKTYTNEQRLIVCQPWYRIYTTNYDDVIENICAEEKKQITTIEISDPVSVPIPDTTQLIHIYGNITRASADEFKRHFLLTESQRDNSPFIKSPWLRRFHDDLLTARSVIFVGFSLNDIDLRRLLGTLPREVLTKVHFVERPSAKKPILNRMNKYGTAHPIGLDALAAHLSVKRTGAPVRQYAAMPMLLKELNFSQQLTSPVSSKDVESLMISGDVNLNKIAQADISGAPGSYTISRSKNAYLRAVKNAAGDRPILVHSDIGNGKTVFAHQIAYQFSQRNFRVFRAEREPENIGEILSFLQALDEPALLIFDDVMKFSSLPEAIIRMNRRNIVVLATVRSIVVDTAKERVRARLGNATSIEIDLNSPQRDECERIVTYLDQNGLLGKNANWSPREKMEFVQKKCGGQLRDIILSLYETGTLHARVSELLQNIQKLGKRERDVIGLGALLSYADFTNMVQFSIVSDLVDYTDGIESLREKLSENELSTLVRLDTGDVLIRSPALAFFILTNVFSTESILQLVKTALFNLDNYYCDEDDFVTLGKNLLKFSLYGPMLKNKRDNKAIERFYDECRTLRFASDDPLFWVQRSICNMHDKQFAISYRFVETAYALAKKMRNYDTYQVDNHRARLMLTQSREEGVSEDGRREQEAMSLLSSVLNRKDDDLYHPLSVMRLYADIVDKWRDKLSHVQKAALKKALDQAIMSIGKSHQSGRFRNLPDVKRRLTDATQQLL
ncbi:conserved hypothetical protein [uncultured Defluviicoccus sp.]|uniref:Uncharacterized protein n=1 Tax=metagenome TaxID=256318 RepID=A0A380TM04_9ZZZZ|nr:conserved hypothetical protein [uncultured Defluviicoccus sp.]